MGRRDFFSLKKSTTRNFGPQPLVMCSMVQRHCTSFIQQTYKRQESVEERIDVLRVGWAIQRANWYKGRRAVTAVGCWHVRHTN
jgi:transposase